MHASLVKNTAGNTKESALTMATIVSHVFLVRSTVLLARSIQIVISPTLPLAKRSLAKTTVHASLVRHLNVLATPSQHLVILRPTVTASVYLAKTTLVALARMKMNTRWWKLKTALSYHLGVSLVLLVLHRNLVHLIRSNLPTSVTHARTVRAFKTMHNLTLLNAKLVHQTLNVPMNVHLRMVIVLVVTDAKVAYHVYLRHVINLVNETLPIFAAKTVIYVQNLKPMPIFAA
mmetsp:Transcript_14816/g.22162  ORF Transcript_14816/g.22162 Transcript_14816/m.22162 type:complete len:232 (-) Transcript_14816:996-1691(-)